MLRVAHLNFRFNPLVKPFSTFGNQNLVKQETTQQSMKSSNQRNHKATCDVKRQNSSVIFYKRNVRQASFHISEVRLALQNKSKKRYTKYAILTHWTDSTVNLPSVPKSDFEGGNWRRNTSWWWSPAHPGAKNGMFTPPAENELMAAKTFS